MPTTTLDIIDTAVKIGLGALISGGTVFLVNISKTKSQREITLRDETKTLIKQISDEIDLSVSDYGSAITLYVTSADAFDVTNTDVIEAMSMERSSWLHMQRAGTFAVLAGEEELEQLIDKLQWAQAKIIPYFRDENLDRESKDYKELGTQKNSISAELRTALKNAFSKFVLPK